MGTIKTLKAGLSFAWKGVKGVNKGVNKGIKINPETLRYIHPEKISAPVDEFVKTVPKKIETAAKTVSDADRMAFKGYVFQRNLNLKITADEIKKLFKYEGEEYQQKAFEFLLNKMNIPRELTPQIMYGGEGTDIGMAYNWALNAVIFNKEAKNILYDKTNFITFLRHELQHWMQNMKCLTHETKGDKFAKKLAEKIFYGSVQNFENQIKNADIEKLKTIYPQDFIQDIVYLKSCLKNNATAEYEQYLKELTKTWQYTFENQLDNLRNTAIEKIGITKAGTKEAKRAEKMIQETLSDIGYFEEGGKVNMGKFYIDCRENEALAAQDALLQQIKAFQGEKFCYLRDIKEQAKNPDAIETFEKIDKEVAPKFNLEELMSYLYD